MRVEKVLSIFVFAFLAFFSSFSLAASPVSTNSSDTQSNLSEAQQKEAKAMKILMIVNVSEVKAGKLALHKSSNPSVKKFAQVMIQQHSQNLKLLTQLSQKTKIKPLDSDKSEELVKKQKEAGDSLKEKSNKDFDVAYIDAMVKGHEKVLKMIDDELLPKASNPEVESYLKVTRNMVAEHLKLAQEVQSKL
jgi:putative membrane protein